MNRSLRDPSLSPANGGFSGDGGNRTHAPFPSSEYIRIPLRMPPGNTVPFWDFAFVDPDCEYLRDFNWRWINGYALASIHLATGGWVTGSMHRMVMGCEYGDGLIVDHINRIKSDNRRANLRVGSHADNMRNTKWNAWPESVVKPEACLFDGWRREAA